MNAVRSNFIRILYNQMNNTSVCAALGRNLSSISFKSAMSLENIYPKSTLKITTPETVPIKIKGFSGLIPIQNLNITYSRSSGPGGQNVNCVNTKVDLRFNIQEAKWIDDGVKDKLVNKNLTRINKEGFLVIKSDLTRSQQLNLADALEKLRTIVRQAYHNDTKDVSPETVERLRRRHEKSVRERLMMKRQRSEIKSGRQSPSVAELN